MVVEVTKDAGNKINNKNASKPKTTLKMNACIILWCKRTDATRSILHASYKRAYRTSLKGEQRLRNKKQKPIFKYPETRTRGRTTHGTM